MTAKLRQLTIRDFQLVMDLVNKDRQRVADGHWEFASRLEVGERLLAHQEHVEIGGPPAMAEFRCDGCFTRRMCPLDDLGTDAFKIRCPHCCGSQVPMMWHHRVPVPPIDVTKEIPERLAR